MERVLRILPPVILIAVACAQLWRWSQSDAAISSWRFGGFGMYADLFDIYGRKIIIIEKTSDKERRLTKVPRNAAVLYRAALVNPSSTNLRELARVALCQSQKRNGGTFVDATIQVWRLSFSAPRNVVQMKLMSEVEFAHC